MICKKCGAYNPDHATFCKVCAANLKDQTDMDDAAEVADVDETVEQESRPKRGNVKVPDFSAVRRAGSFKATPKTEEEPIEDEDNNEEEDLNEEEETVKSAGKKSIFSRPAASVKKRRIVDEEEDEDDDDEDEDDEYDEEDSEAEKLESEPKTTRFARSVSKKRRIIEENDDGEEDDEDDEDEDDEDEYDDDDGYEEYEPTPPRRKKSGNRQGKGSGGSNVLTLLIVCLLAILLIIVGIIAFCNLKGGATKSKLPGFLQFNCAGKAATVEKTQPVEELPVDVEPETDLVSDPTEAPVTGTQVDYSATKLEELVDSEGKPCISISMTSRPGDTVTIVLPNQDDYVVQNNEASDVPYLLTIPKSCFYPNAPLTDSVYTVTPQILVAHADGTQESLSVDSFDITFPTIQLELLEPAQATIPAEGIMASEGNELMLKGKVDDHTVTVTVNGQPVAIYEGGSFEYTFSLTGETAETVNIEASKANYVSSSYSFVVTPYIFIPEPMPLSVGANVSQLKADKQNKVTVTGVTAPGATLTASPAPEYQSSIACGSPTVDAEGNFSFEVTFDKKYYGIATINLHSKKDGYEEGDISCMVARMYKDQKSAVSGYNKTKSYHEIYRNYTFASVMADPSANGLYRFSGKIVEVDPETGIITFAAMTAAKETTNIYVLNASDKWEPDKHVGDSYLLYCTLNGLHTDGSSLYVTAWFIRKN